MAVIKNPNDTDIGDAIVAIYIGKTGKVLAIEQLGDASRKIVSENQLDMLPGPEVPTELVEIEVSVERQKMIQNAPRPMGKTTYRICRDVFGNICPCF